MGMQSLMSLEQCLLYPNSVVKYITPKQNQGKKIIRPLIREIIEDCPKSIRPTFKTQENIWRFPNGSEIQIAGTDNGSAENIRGGKSHLCIVDEAGFCQDLQYVIRSILLPTTITTNGRLVIATTPPKELDHEFNEFWEEAELKNALKLKTIFDAARLTIDEIHKIIEENGGITSQFVRREYLCEKIMDEERAIIPEFTADVHVNIVKDWKRPPHYDTYVSGDIGFKDLTAILFAYFDFRENKIVVEDELIMNGPSMTTDILAKEIRDKETSLWGDVYTQEHKEPYMRICDNNLIVINDLYKLHNILFLPAQKDNAEAAINDVRIMIGGKRIIISPKCKTLIHHLKNGRWNKQRTSFARSPDAGHYDAIDALKYLVRHIDLRKNPYPRDFGITDRMNTFFSYYQDEDPLMESIKGLFKVKSTVKQFKPKD
jgi:hypothetical protein